MAELVDDSFSVANAEYNILFVFGAARSGTTYLGRILEDVFDFGMGPEGHFVPEFAKKLEKYGDLEVATNMDRLIADVSNSTMLTIMRDRWRDEIRTDISMQMIHSELPHNTYGGLISSVFYCVAREQGKTRVGNKNPDYWRCLDLIESTIPDRARYLHIVRDGRDVAMSNMKMKWGQDNILSSAKTWRDCVGTTARFADQVGPDRFLEIRYEDLLDKPDNFRQSLDQKPKTTPKKGNHGKWESELSSDEKRIYEAVAGDSLRRYGYNTVLDSPRIGLLENITMSAGELWRKIKLNLWKT
jgi:hypothetical protein